MRVGEPSQLHGRGSMKKKATTNWRCLPALSLCLSLEAQTPNFRIGVLGGFSGRTYFV
jgi:hypothetical protein